MEKWREGEVDNFSSGGRRIRLGFRHNGFSGWIDVTARKNTGVLSSGFNAIDRRFTDSLIRGFPVLKADVSFRGRGYQAMFGWFQSICIQKKGGETGLFVDLAPQFQEFRNPICYYGYKPSLYDAPSNNDPGIMKWKAYTFLCPLFLSRVKRIKIIPLVGFTWGFTMKDGKPEEILYPVKAEKKEWEFVRASASEDYPDWEFMDFP